MMRKHRPTGTDFYNISKFTIITGSPISWCCDKCNYVDNFFCTLSKRNER